MYTVHVSSVSVEEVIDDEKVCPDIKCMYIGQISSKTKFLTEEMVQNSDPLLDPLLKGDKKGRGFKFGTPGFVPHPNQNIPRIFMWNNTWSYLDA